MPLALWYSGEKTQILCVFLIKTDSVMLAALVNAGDGIFHPFRNVYCVVADSFKISPPSEDPTQLSVLLFFLRCTESVLP